MAVFRRQPIPNRKDAPPPLAVIPQLAVARALIPPRARRFRSVSTKVSIGWRRRPACCPISRSTSAPPVRVSNQLPSAASLISSRPVARAPSRRLSRCPARTNLPRSRPRGAKRMGPKATTVSTPSRSPTSLALQHAQVSGTGEVLWSPSRKTRCANPSRRAPHEISTRSGARARRRSSPGRASSARWPSPRPSSVRPCSSRPIHRLRPSQARIPRQCARAQSCRFRRPPPRRLTAGPPPRTTP